MIYLDYAANHPVDPAVLERFCAVERSFPGNPNSRHTMGRAACGEMERITDSVAELLGVDPKSVIFTSGATEANNLAIKGIARSTRHCGRHIISTPVEHASASASVTWLQEQGYEVDLLPLGRDGRVDLEELEYLLRKDTVLVTVPAVDSELGTVQPVAEIRKLVSRFPNCHLHVDATQAIGRIPFDFSPADTVSFAPHKFGGLNGCGVLVKRKDLVIEPQLHGGESTTIYRSGTPALALAASVEAALRPAVEQMEARTAHVTALRRKLQQGLEKYPNVRINSPSGAVPHILNLSIKGVKGGTMQQVLDERGICVSVKSACSVEGTPSRAVFAVSRDRNNARSSWRISLSHLTTEQEIEEFLRQFDACYQELTGEQV
ncbi:MAG: cysteine desulfurase family protein [Lachnospiraceae bacterium]|nr:cysteine desulfurase family protein [Lachnospiraceae bacterium]